MPPSLSRSQAHPPPWLCCRSQVLGEMDAGKFGRAGREDMKRGCTRRIQACQSRSPSIHRPLSDRTIAPGGTGTGRSRPFPAFALFPLWASPAALSWSFRPPVGAPLSWAIAENLCSRPTRTGKDIARYVYTVHARGMGFHGISAGEILETLETLRSKTCTMYPYVHVRCMCVGDVWRIYGQGESLSLR
ncbi:uncharacterized protein LY79DRAFT_547663 [Colletotrichum navitas]|uniref:Uncharacterized protein n=1 Tax=Colletotrichum navitas TaxID=681940 RepID=A0AAD8Q3R0_9PEZI|nr:uncharacterized protein LY79DRAFT_547663 [Colletotrichum navitas]KAK1594973.1 hypothetical protein LY79DRAFT_547663 [Colletotrichum navitas]